LLVSELCANAILHTDSGKPGGKFSLTVEWTRRTVKALILDQGSPTVPTITAGNDALDDEYGRGLFLVDQLADHWDTADLPDGRLVWLEIPWKAKGGPSLRTPGGYQAAIGGVAALCGQFPRTAIWWGHQTEFWWAALPGAVGEIGVVHAPTLDALSTILKRVYPSFLPPPEHGLTRQDAAALPSASGDRCGRRGAASRFPGETPPPFPSHH
jgi:hypothetical protein